jgi:ABC-type bacteriocin/lantibiotic exporter with double-glycine peptidase domain
MRKDFKKLVDKIISSLDWDSIQEVHHAFKLGVGEGSEVIPGLKRKAYSENISKNDLKAELRKILRFVIDNDISKIVYGPWMVFWFNQDWEILYDSAENNEEVNDEDLQDELDDLKIDSRLEAIYSPQRICLTVNADKKEDSSSDPEFSMLSQMMDKAIKKENYELAKKIKDVMDLTNNGGNKDK